MIRAILISPSDSFNAELLRSLAEDNRIEVAAVLDSDPTPETVTQSIRVLHPDMVFLSSQNLPHFEAVAAALSVAAPGLPVVSVGDPADTELLLRLMPLGVREHLAAPVSRERIDAVAELVERLRRHQPAPLGANCEIYSFLPSRGGVGTSTLAGCLSNILANELQERTLLMDGDLAAGTVQFQFNLGQPATLLDALQWSEKLDESIWFDLVGTRGKLDVLHAGGSDRYPVVPAAALQAVLSIARKHYRHICVDLGANVNPFTESILRESSQIFLVTTTQLTALRLTLGKLARLTEMGLLDRVTVLLNRVPHSKRVPDPDEVAKILGDPPILTFHEDRAGPRLAELKGEPVSTESELGQSIASLAKILSEPQAAGGEAPTPRGRRFLEHFRVPLHGDTDPSWQD